MPARRRTTRRPSRPMRQASPAKGILQNLVVEPELDGDGLATGFYFVTIGEGRRLAQLLRVKRKEIKKTEPIRCIVDTANDPHEINLDENVTRENMLGSVFELSC
jgi:ParB family transcriptional regulator, chromosome partitioning protein